MASIYHLDLIPATSSEDVLGIASVSGFYGPGTYAAWIVTVAASWLNLRRGKQTQDVHHIAHLLYTNWAAIDLLHQLSVINHIEPTTGLPHDSVSNLASVAAAFTATYWGMLQASVQYILCVFYFDMAFEHESRSILFLFGLIIPSLTGPAYLYSLRSYMAKMYLYPYEPGSHLITTLYYDGIDQSQHKWHMFWASFLMAAACPLVCIAAAHTLWIRYSRKEWTIEGTSIYASLIMPMAIVCTGVEALTYVSKAVYSGFEMVPKSCFFMPCAPQKISDWDQSFSLFIALSIFVYEHGLLMWKVITRRAPWIRMWLRRMV